MTAFLTLFAVFFGILQISSCQPKLTSKEKDLIVELHNGYRKLQRSSDMKKLIWDEALAREARLWADRCNYDFRLKSTGENMYYFESNLPNDVLLERAIDAWYSERYTWKMSGDCADACSYTQLVWAKSTKIGCAVNKCPELTLPEEYVPNAWFLYCVYDPKGNVYGDKPFIQGEACSRCEQNEVCSEKLCTAKHTVRSLPRMQPGSNKRENPTMWEDLNKSRSQNSRAKKVVAGADFSPWSQRRIDITVPTPSPDTLKGRDIFSGIQTFRQEQREKQRGYYPQRPQQAFFRQQPQQQVPYQTMSDKANYGNKYNSSMQKLLMDDNAEAMRLITGKGKSTEKESSSSSGNPQSQQWNKPIYSTMTRGRSNNLEKNPYPKDSFSPWNRKQMQARPVIAVRHFRSKPPTKPTTTTPKPTTKKPTPKPDFEPRRVVIGKVITTGNKFSIDDIRKKKTAVSFKFDFPTRSPGKDSLQSKSSNGFKGPALMKTGFGNFMADGRKTQNTAIGHQLFSKPTPVAVKQPQSAASEMIKTEDCKDNNVYCEHWVIYCKSNAYVFENCKKSCKNCNIPAPPPLPPPGGAPKLKKCMDLNEYCPHWKKYCYRNKYVTSQCQKQCGTCGQIGQEQLAMVTEGTTSERPRGGYDQNMPVTVDLNNVRDNRFIPTTTYPNERNNNNMIPPRVKSFRQDSGNSMQQSNDYLDNFARRTMREMTTEGRLAFRGHTAAPDTTTPYIPPQQPTITTTLMPPTTYPSQYNNYNNHNHNQRRRNQVRTQQRMHNLPHSNVNHNYNPNDNHHHHPNNNQQPNYHQHPSNNQQPNYHQHSNTNQQPTHHQHPNANEQPNHHSPPNTNQQPNYNQSPATTTVGWNNDPNVGNNYNNQQPQQTTPYTYKETTSYSYNTNTDYNNIGAGGGNQCVDTDYRCVSWAEYCGRNPYTDQNCLKTCLYC